MANMLKGILGIALFAMVVLAPAGSALAGPPQRFVVFGDSLSDPGNAFVLSRNLEVPPFTSLIPDAPYARGALHFSNGLTWIEQLSFLDHALPTAGPGFLRPKVFSNYAVGGARARLPGPVDLSAQVRLFNDEFHGHAPAGALYVVWTGGNDVRDALEALAKDPTGAASAFILQQAVFSIRDNLLVLHGAGARRFLVPNAPDIGLAPAVRLLGPAAQGAASLLSAQFNSGLELMLQGAESGLGVEIVRLNVFGILREVVAQPANFGLTNVTATCIRLNVIANAFCERPGQFLFWDGIHPTVAGHRILAKRAHAVLMANGGWRMAEGAQHR
jgi:phospholipase/lecithinase/hemolysin